MKQKGLRLQFLRLALPVLNTLAKVFHGLNNRFCAIVLKSPLAESLQPWLKFEEGVIILDDAYMQQAYESVLKVQPDP